MMHVSEMYNAKPYVLAKGYNHVIGQVAARRCKSPLFVSEADKAYVSSLDFVGRARFGIEKWERMKDQTSGTAMQSFYSFMKDRSSHG